MRSIISNFVSIFQESISKKTLTLVREYNDVYQKWANDKVQGAQGMLGASYKFDW